ncbi:DUF2147 domain-containing protein [Croceivirga thetidis]|uniref:DUF2147 domain-containing protein n=1 Tax=Croceivirga thetidis TaxID=2721623 RepID=A0ABX1GPI7_9FLAO|nr:DUF2147 domain-containing protein [Croceivirga thetidis]NKI31822.1 DUF2147 domain-containing protein [Croceivirga thetidis]
MKLFGLFCLFLFANLSLAQNITGEWETYDDETQEKKALINIYESNGKYFAKIVRSYISDQDAVCENCKGDKKDQPIAGLVIIEGLEEDGDEYNGGTIMDPENGKTYKCYIELMDDGKLKVRGYLGISLLGRTQYWRRKVS